MKTLKVALAVQCLFFAAWGGRLLASSRGGQEIWLRTVPVDPRDLLSGHYVALSYDLNRPSAQGCAEVLALPDGASVFVELQPSTATSHAAGRKVELWDAKACRAVADGLEGTWARATVRRGTWRGPSLEFGIERFYVSERSSLREAHSGQVFARVSLRRRKLSLRDIVTPDGP